MQSVVYASFLVPSPPDLCSSDLSISICCCALWDTVIGAELIMLAFLYLVNRYLLVVVHFRRNYIH